MPKPLTTRHSTEDKVYHATCRYCKGSFEYYVREDKPVNCMRTECIQRAVEDGVYKNFKDRKNAEQV